MSGQNIWSELPESLRSEGEGAHPVCIVHLAFVPCRHGRDYSTCIWSEDAEAQKVVSRFHAGEMSRWEARDVIREAGLKEG